MRYSLHSASTSTVVSGGAGWYEWDITSLVNDWVKLGQKNDGLILIGDGWQTVFGQVMRSFEGYIPAVQKELLQFAPDIQSAVELLENNS